VGLLGDDGLGQPLGFVDVDPDGLPSRYSTVVASPGADIPKDHEGGAASFPALPDVGTPSFFTDRVQLGVLQEVPQLDIVGAAGHPDLHPLGQSLRCI